MLTISGMHKGETKLTIPNQVVREQLFAYILDTYHENDLTFDRYEKRKLASGLAYDGKWKPYFEYIAGCLHRYASQQDKQKGEYFVHGFTLAMTAQKSFLSSCVRERQSGRIHRPVLASVIGYLQRHEPLLHHRTEIYQRKRQ